ncbi:MAG: DUF4252 domain-containing protein [Chlorobi bacterium]|nr:DUF4252 domain-containing protein [Chlorobiota bacterium]
MRYILPYFILILFSAGLNAQEFERLYENNPSVDMVIITPDMFELINEVNKDPERSVFFKDLTYFGMFGSTDAKVSENIMRRSAEYAGSKHMKLLLKIKDPQKQALFYYIPAGEPGFAREIVLLIHYPGQGKVRMWHIKGHINLRKISLLALQRTRIDEGILKEAEKQAQ